MASRGVKPIPFGKPSGRPWDAHFVNVAQQAGLRSPVIYGSPDHNDYVVESMGCGAAFLDYDNDGWQDIVLLSGRRLQSTPAGAVIRLYRNNRDGTFADVTEKSGLGQSVWATGITVADYDNDGHDDLFITCWGQNLLFHNNGDGTFTDVTAKAGLTHHRNPLWHGLHVARLRSRRPPGSLRIPLPRVRPGQGCDPWQRSRLQLSRRAGLLRARPACRRRVAACITTTAMAPSRT